ncbi:MAG: RNA 2',3'-cyclic phosphodiesterase [Spirochaetaceae bacterium]|nr:RNA 2',3'-cyclic phosphodiesterase [Spirochaetaceae bacterium]
MRLFIAVNFDDEVKRGIQKLQEKLRARASRGKFSRPDNLHLTLAFLGETPEERLDAVSEILESVNSPPFDISFNRTGFFRRSRKELWWLGADPAAPGISILKTMQAQLIQHLEKENFSVDTRPFNPHITLGREIASAAPIVLDCPAISVHVDRISLMKSENIRGMLIYTELRQRCLSAAP